MAPALLILPVVALLTAAVSAISGMGGGILLLAAMFAFLPHGEAIPVHGAVQFVSNSTRTLAYLPHVDWRTVGRFLMGVIPGSVLGIGVIVALGEIGAADPWLKLLVSMYIFTTLLLPKPARRASVGVWWDFPLLGVAAGAAAFLVGAIGPLIAPLFARRDFVKERLVATKAVCQSLLHLAKIPVFLYLGTLQEIPSLTALTIGMAVAVIPGTLLGRYLIRYVSERLFVRLFQIVLVIAASKIMIFDAALPLLTQS